MISISAGNIALVPIVFFLVVAALGIAVIAAIVMIIRGFQLRRESERLSQEEALQMRRLMESLGRMEERIVNLETILLEMGKRPENRYNR